jgi:two-component system alkaline phosphatase synthesis response regulator PhoP
MPKKILIIDDQPFVLKLIEYNLKKNGYETVTETNGLNAFDQIDSIRPDLIILDVRMPHISGNDLCRCFRNRSLTAKIPIIMLTGHLDDNSEQKAIDAGANSFMTKPFSPFELINTIKKFLDNNEQIKKEEEI